LRICTSQSTIKSEVLNEKKFSKVTLLLSLLRGITIDLPVIPQSIQRCSRGFEKFSKVFSIVIPHRALSSELTFENVSQCRGSRHGEVLKDILKRQHYNYSKYRLSSELIFENFFIFLFYLQCLESRRGEVFEEIARDGTVLVKILKSQPQGHFIWQLE